MGHGQKTMLFAHGFGCDQHAWKDVAPAFYADHKVVLFDFVGAGRSDLSLYDKPRYDSIEGYAEDILDICRALELRDIIFVGHSVSCMIGALASIKDPAIFGNLIFVCPSPRYLDDENYVGGLKKNDLELLFELMDDDYIGWAQTTAPAIMGNDQGPELGKLLSDNFCSLDPEIARQFARVTFLSDNRKDLEEISVPSLTLQCHDDMLAPMEVGYYVQEHTPDNQLTVLEATGHCPHMSAPEETVHAIKTYLSA